MENQHTVVSVLFANCAAVTFLELPLVACPGVPGPEFIAELIGSWSFSSNSAGCYNIERENINKNNKIKTTREK